MEEDVVPGPELEWVSRDLMERLHRPLCALAFSDKHPGLFEQDREEWQRQFYLWYKEKWPNGYARDDD